MPSDQGDQSHLQILIQLEHHQIQIYSFPESELEPEVRIYIVDHAKVLFWNFFWTLDLITMFVIIYSDSNVVELSLR